MALKEATMIITTQLLNKVVAALLAIILVATNAHAEKRIALSFDDVPRQKGAFLTPDDRTVKLIAALQKAKVKQAAFFINPGKLSDPDGAGGEGRITAYVNAGHVIANHSFSHPKLGNTDTDAYLADIDTASAWLKDRDGNRPWFRFPYLDEGGDDKVKRDAIRAGLKARGLRNGYVTADGSDWHLETLTVEAMKASKPMDMDALKKLYVSVQMSAVEYHDVMAQRTLGRSPAHVILLHETDLAALFIEDFVAELRLNGWTIITADEAFADPIASAMPDVPFAYGTLIGSMAWEKDVKPPVWPFWIGTATATFLFDRRVTKTPEPR
jgi:peptidoglycan-N-acetylglucosamine deacetylase